jgi:hypothetical protein
MLTTFSHVPNVPGSMGVTIGGPLGVPVAGCTMQFSIHGTDNYSKSEDVTTDAGGTGSFSIPGGAAGVVDTVTVGIGGHVSTLVYTF